MPKIQALASTEDGDSGPGIMQALQAFAPSVPCKTCPTKGFKTSYDALLLHLFLSQIALQY